MAPSRRRKSSTGFSLLPEPLIVHILSFLCIGDRIRTGVLSKSWQNLWTRVSNLSIRYGVDGPRYDDDNEFFDFVEKTLVSILSDGSTIKSFRVVCPHGEDYDPKINIWTLLATTHGFQEFELDFSDINETDTHDLSQYIFMGSSFRELRFSVCFLKPLRSVSWKSLKILSMSSSLLGEGAIENILAGSPVLEILELSNLYDLECLDLGNSSVKKLLLHFGLSNDGFDLSAPKLQSLQISGTFCGECNARVESLVEASITGVQWQEPEYGGSDFPSFVREFLGKLLHAETLALDSMAIEATEWLYLEGIMSECKSLTIDTHLWATRPSVIAKLLKSCRDLELLTISMSGESKRLYDEVTLGQLEKFDDFWKSQKLVFNGLKLLKTVKYIGFQDYWIVAFLIAEFVLEKASVLQKLIVNMKAKDSTRSVTAEDISEASRKLKQMRRTSYDANIIVY